MAYPILAANYTWYKSSAARSTITQINIVNSYTSTGHDEVWNADVGNTGSIKCYRKGTVITMAGNGSGKIAMNADSSRMFYFSDTSDVFSALTAISGTNLLDCSNVTSLRLTFNYCSLLTTIDVSNWNVSNVAEFRATFQNCTALTTLDVSNWNTSGCTDIQFMFNKCSSLTTINVSNWDVSNVTTMKSTFQGCTALTTVDVSKWDTSACTDMQGMFNGATALTTIDVSNWDTSKVTTMRTMFQQTNYGEVSSLIELDLSNWDVSNVTDMSWMVYGCSKLPSLNVSKWDVSKVESFNHMFAHCKNLVITGLENWKTDSATNFNGAFHSVNNTYYDVSGWNTSKVETFAQMFESNEELLEIKGLENWDTSSAKNFGEMFSGCASLTKLDLSSFDTRNVSRNWTDPISGGVGNMLMFHWNYNLPLRNLREIKVGVNFTLKGDGTCSGTFPIPDPEYIEGAEGVWYNDKGECFDPSEIPAGVAATYYATFPFEKVLIKYDTLKSLSKSLRALTGDETKYTPVEMINAIDTLLSPDSGHWKYLLENGTSLDAVNIQSVTASEGVVSKIKLGNTFLYGEPMQNFALLGTTDPGGTELFSGKGYCDDMRWSSSSAKVSSQAGGRVSGWIPFEKGATLRIKNFGMTKTGYVSGAYIVYYGSDGKITTATIGVQSEDSYTTTLSSSANYLYFRISGYSVDETPIVTLNEQIIEGW